MGGSLVLVGHFSLESVVQGRRCGTVQQEVSDGEERKDGWLGVPEHEQAIRRSAVGYFRLKLTRRFRFCARWWMGGGEGNDVWGEKVGAGGAAGWGE